MLFEVNHRFVSLAKSFIKPKWPKYRGNRAGRAVLERNLRHRAQIEVIQRRAVNQNVSLQIVQNHTRRHNIANCIKINVEPPANRRGSSSTFVPSLYLSNVNMLCPWHRRSMKFAILQAKPRWILFA